MIIPGSVPPDTAWFACVGAPLSADDIRDAQAYLSALGCAPHIEVRPVSSWQEAERIVRDRNWDTRCWQTEDDERARLRRDVGACLGEAVVLERLSALAARDSAVIHTAASIAAAAEPEALLRCASGAAAMAAHEHALAHLAGCGPEHLFMRKYRLFENGRWPLSVVSERFYLF